MYLSSLLTILNHNLKTNAKFYIYMGGKAQLYILLESHHILLEGCHLFLLTKDIFLILRFLIKIKKFGLPSSKKKHFSVIQGLESIFFYDSDSLP